MGKTSRMMSVSMFKTAVAMNTGVRSMQDPSVIVISKFLLTGLHAKIKGNTRATL